MRKRATHAAVLYRLHAATADPWRPDHHALAAELLPDLGPDCRGVLAIEEMIPIPFAFVLARRFQQSFGLADQRDLENTEPRRSTGPEKMCNICLVSERRKRTANTKMALTLLTHKHLLQAIKE
jgi:hypothetical protein